MLKEHDLGNKVLGCLKLNQNALVPLGLVWI